MISIRNPIGLSLEQLSCDMTRCFEEYIIPAVFSPGMLSSMICLEAIDLSNSLVAYSGEELVGVLLVCRRGRASRVGAMAIAKPYRRQGVGRTLMERAIDDSVRRKDERLVLEAIEQNVGAIAFYEALGLKINYRLLGFKHRLGEQGSPDVITETDFGRMATLLHARPPTAFVWDMSGAAVGQLSNPSLAFEHDGLAVAITPTGDQKTIICRSMALTDFNDASKLQQILTGLACRYPGRELKIPVYYPEPEFKELFVGAGFEPESISQVQMELIHRY